MKHKKFWVFVTIKSRIMPLRVTITGEKQAARACELIKPKALFAWVSEAK